MISIPAAPTPQVQILSIYLAQEQVQVITKTGLPDWDLVFPSTMLFIENARIQYQDSILLYGVHQGPLAVYLSRNYPHTKITITDHTHTSLEVTYKTLQANSTALINILGEVEMPEEMSGRSNLVYIHIPKGRQLARRWLVQAWHALELGGSLYLAGANSAGIQSLHKDARALFDNGDLLAYRHSNRIARFVKKSGSIEKPAWAFSPGIALGTWVEFPINFGGHVFQIRSLPGVFSSDRLDEGTELLLSVARITPGSRVLDVGCGYGIIGLYAAAEGAGEVHLTDNNLLAIAASKATLALNNVLHAQVYAGDSLTPVSYHKYDLILSNPPFHSGQAVNYQIAEAMIAQSFDALNMGGSLVIVTNRFIRYDQLFQSIFGNVSVLAESGKFRVLSGLKSG